jgi:hypothetical protein
MSRYTAFASRARRLLAPTVVALAAIAAGCAEVGTDPTEAVSIEFNRLPSPSILVGDMLRDLEGNPVVLRDSVWVFNQSNDTIHDYPVRFVATIDSSRIQWDPATGYLVSVAPTGLRTVGIQAQAGSLFPPPVPLAIVPAAPDSLAFVDPEITTVLAINFVGRDTISTSSEELTTRLYAGDSLVNSWPVKFRVVSMPASVDSVAFVGTRADTLRASRASPFDTTAGGAASRLVLARLRHDQANGTDTLVVRAFFRVRGEPVDSVEWRLPVIVNRSATASGAGSR